MKTLRSYVLIIFAAVLLAGCATAPAPRNAEQTIAYGTAAIASARSNAAALLDAGTINVDQAKQVQTVADMARGAFDAAAAAFNAGDAARGNEQLSRANALLVQLQVVLKQWESRK